MKIAIIGQGYVGRSIAQAAVGAGHSVVGFDTNSDVISSLKKAGLSFTPANGTHYLKEFVNVVCKNKGGDGAVREMLEYIIKEDEKNKQFS